MSRDRDRFMRPIQYLPHLATPTKTPREVMMDELGMGGKSCIRTVYRKRHYVLHTNEFICRRWAMGGKKTSHLQTGATVSVPIIEPALVRTPSFITPLLPYKILFLYIVSRKKFIFYWFYN